MAIETVLIVHQDIGSDEIAITGSCQRWLEVRGTLGRSRSCPLLRILTFHKQHGDDNGGDDSAVGEPNAPFDRRPRQSMQPVKPDPSQWRDDMSPVNRLSDERLLQFKYPGDSCQKDAAHQQNHADREQCVSHPNRDSIASLHGRERVEKRENRERKQEQKPQDEMQQKVEQVKVILIGFLRHRLQHGNARKVHRIRRKQSK